MEAVSKLQSPEPFVPSLGCGHSDFEAHKDEAIQTSPQEAASLWKLCIYYF